MNHTTHHHQDLIALFNQCFEQTYNTVLVKGGDEPIYLPADDTSPQHRLHFAHGFFSSALHECSHWLIAGETRRQQVDFGYWYAPDGRNAEQQQLFQQLEVKPQALEWILSVAAGHRFQVSVDNLNGETLDTAEFEQAIYQQVNHYCQTGLPKRAKIFREVLCQFYRTPSALGISDFRITPAHHQLAKPAR